MSNFNLEGESFLLDVAVALTSGLKRYLYEPGASVFMVREEALQMKVYDPEKQKHYTIIIKEDMSSETDTKISKN